MKDLKAHITFVCRGTGDILVETISYFVPDDKDTVQVRKADKTLLTCRVYERWWLFDENRVTLFVDVV